MFKNVLIFVLIFSAAAVGVGDDFRGSVCLNGTWEFRLVEPVEQKEFRDIAVPGHWELQGFSRPLWRWPKKEMGVYKTEIEVPDSWEGKKICINFGGVLYLAKVYIDGEFAGEHEGGYNEFEVDVTEFVKAGTKAELKVEVYTYGKYFDCDSLDFWALAGIYRDVKLVCRPAEHVAKWQYSTKWDDKRAEVFVSGQLNENIDGEVVFKLGFEGEKFLEEKLDVECGIFEGVVGVDGPKGWTAETPYLYDAELVVQKDGEVIDVVRDRVGLREISVEGGRLMVNGRAIRIFGVARHDLWPEVGRAIGDDVTKLDIELMKKTGINAVRTAHHTCERAFLEMADEVGLYVIDNIAMSNIYKRLQSDPNYTEGVLVRTRETIGRDILHPSVIIWAMGNELPMCYQHKKMYEEIRRLDQSRLAIMPSHMGEEEFPELNSMHYPTGYSLLRVLMRYQNKPVICTEYQHCGFEGMGGGLGLFWDIMDISGCGVGGTAWEWMDQGIKHDWAGNWEGRWWRGPEKNDWPVEVTIRPGEDTRDMPSGFGPGDSRTPVTINIQWDGEAGEYVLRLYVLASSKSERIEVSCDEEFAGVYHTKDAAMSLSYPVKLRFAGEHRVSMKWDYIGEGHNFDCMELVDGEGDVVWRIGEKDESAGEFATRPGSERVDELWMDTATNQGEDGMLGPRREKQDEYYNFAGVYAPVQMRQKTIDLINYKWVVDVENRYSFTDLDSRTEFVVQFYDGGSVSEKILEGPVLRLGASSKKRVELDVSFVGKMKNVAAIGWQVPGEGKYCPDELGQIWFNFSERAIAKSDKGAEIQSEVDGDRITVKAGETEVVFDKGEGALVSYSVGGKRLIEDAVKVSMWRPSFSFEQQFLYYYAMGGMSREKKKFIDREPDGDFVRKCREMQYKEYDDRFVVTFINQYLLSGTSEGLMRGFEVYEVDKQGTVMLKCCWWWQGRDSQLRRLGFDFALPVSLDMMTWSGLGPWGCYRDAKDGVYDRVHQLGRDDDNIKTNKTGCKWVKWCDGDSGLVLDPQWEADIVSSVFEGVTIQKVSRARGCGNKHMLALPETWVWAFNNEVIQMAIEIKGY